MCTRKIVVTRTMLGRREQGWMLWAGKEIAEMTSKEIIAALGRGEEILGLAVGSNGELEPDKGFFTRNIMEHRQVGNYKPMVEEDNCMANVFYIVMGKAEQGGYEVISTKFERAVFSEEKVMMMLEMGIISAGAKLVDGKVVLPILGEAGGGKAGADEKPASEEKAAAAKTEKKPEAKKQAGAAGKNK